MAQQVGWLFKRSHLMSGGETMAVDPKMLEHKGPTGCSIVKRLYCRYFRRQDQAGMSWCSDMRERIIPGYEMLTPTSASRYGLDRDVA